MEKSINITTTTDNTFITVLPQKFHLLVLLDENDFPRFQPSHNPKITQERFEPAQFLLNVITLFNKLLNYINHHITTSQ